MEAIIREYLEKITLGDVQIHKHVAVIPLIGGNGAGPDYLTMKEAMARQLLIVTEVSEGGSVPELKVINRAEKPVLLLDGEELSGAKQNRVLNTTILLKEISETIIPVSCTEHGRWGYRTPRFEDSDHIMSARLRRVKNASVHDSLKAMRGHRSNQGEVWDEIAIQAMMNKQSSVTGAMKDVLDAKKPDMDAFLEHYPVVDGQTGLLVLVNGEVIGLDVIPKKEAFGTLHPKLARSYVMDALTQTPETSPKSPGEKVEAFLKKVLTCTEQPFDAVGYGRDYRYEGKRIVGSALVHETAIIHMAFFSVTETERAGRMAPASRRRNYRTQ